VTIWTTPRVGTNRDLDELPCLHQTLEDHLPGGVNARLEDFVLVGQARATGYRLLQRRGHDL